MKSAITACAVLWAAAALAAPPRLTDQIEVPRPTWETQKQARTYLLHIPAPRGQITDRNGAPLDRIPGEVVTVDLLTGDRHEETTGHGVTGVHRD